MQLEIENPNTESTPYFAQAYVPQDRLPQSRALQTSLEDSFAYGLSKPLIRRMIDNDFPVPLRPPTSTLAKPRAKSISTAASQQ